MPITRPLTKYQRAGDFLGSVWGYVLPFNRVLAKPWGWRTIFIAPTKLGMFNRSHSTDDTPSVSFADSSLREGAGDGLHHSSVYSLNRKVTGDFHRPYGRAGSIYRSTCPFWGQFIFPVCRSPGGFWTASSRSPGTCRPGFPWPPSGALPGSWWGRRSRWRCRRGGGGR